MQRFTAPPEIGLRPAGPGGAGVAQRRASDVLPVGPAIEERGRRNWAMALIASVARTSWLPVVLTVAFVGGGFIATWAGGRSVGGAISWILMGSGVWLAVAVLLTALRHNR